MLEFLDAWELSIANTYLTKQPEQLVTYTNAERKSQIDFFITSRHMLGKIKNVKVINGEEASNSTWNACNGLTQVIK